MFTGKKETKKKRKKKKEKKKEEVRACTWKEVGGWKVVVRVRWVVEKAEVGGQKTSEKSSVGLDGVRRCSQTVRQRRQTDRHAGRNENNNTQRGRGP